MGANHVKHPFSRGTTMNKTTKGALAAGAAAVLLMGGAGTLAYWSDSVDVPGGAVNGGTLSLGTPDCGVGWELDGGTAYTGQDLVPGDVLSKVCVIDLVAEGEHLGADLAIATPSWTGDANLITDLDATAVFTVNGATVTHVTDADDTGVDEIEATLQVTFDPAATNGSNGGFSAALDAVTVSATQTHDG